MAQPGDLKTSLDYFAPMGRRAIIPLITANKTSPHGPNGNIPDCRNLQGDVFLFSKVGILELNHLPISSLPMKIIRMRSVLFSSEFLMLFNSENLYVLFPQPPLLML